MKTKITFIAGLLLAASVFFTLFTGSTGTGEPEILPPTVVYSLDWQTTWGFKHHSLFYMLDESGNGARAQDKAIAAMVSEGIFSLLLDDVFTSHLIISHHTVQQKYLGTVDTNLPNETIQQRLGKLPGEVVGYLRYIKNKYPQLRLRLGLRSIPLSLNFVPRPDTNRDSAYVVEDPNDPGYDLPIIVPNKQITSSGCFPSDYDKKFVCEYFSAKPPVLGEMANIFMDKLSSYYVSQSYQSANTKSDLTTPYFDDSDINTPIKEPYVGDRYQRINGFYPGYFADVPCSSGTQTYFDVNRYISFLDDFFDTLYNDPVLNANKDLSIEYSNEPNLIGSTAWLSPSEFRELAVKVYTSARNAGFSDVAIGGFSNGFLAGDIDDTLNDNLSKALFRYYRDDVLPGIISDLKAAGAPAPVFSFHQYSEPRQQHSMEKLEAFNQQFKLAHGFDLLEKSVLTEFHLTSDSRDATHQAFLQSPALVGELGLVMDLAALHHIPSLYLFNLVELPGQTPDQCNHMLSFFDCDGNPRASYNHLLTVYRLVKNGYTATRYRQKVNRGFPCKIQQAGDKNWMEYTEIISKEPVNCPFTPQPVGFGPTRGRLILRVAVSCAPKVKDGTVVASYYLPCDSCADEFMTKGSWEMYTDCSPTVGGRAEHPIIFVPNPANCEGVEGRWEGIDLTGFNEVRFELSEVNTGQIVRLMAVNKEINKIQLYSCELRQGLHEGRVIADGQVVARGNLMIAR